jgi:putative phosphoesterase
MEHQQTSTVIVVGVISDTHGPVTDEAAAALLGVDHILFAGDIVSDDAIPTLQKIAGVTAVRGNMDGCGEPSRLPRTAMLELGGVGIYVIHDLNHLDLAPKAAGISLVIHGHTHRASLDTKNDVLYLNPGSAALPRGPMSSSVARVSIVNGRVFPEIVPLRSVKDIVSRNKK